MPVSAEAWRVRRIVSWAVLAIPVGVFLAVLACNSVNTPRDDDLQSLVPFVNRWPLAHGFAACWGLLTEQYYGHRIASTRLATLLVSAMSGRLDVLPLQVTGWCTWIALAVLVLRRSPAIRQHAWLGLPVLLVMMQPQGQSNLLIGMQAIQNVGVVLLAFGALRLAEIESPLNAVASVLLGLAAIFTSANGVLVLPLVALVNWYDGRRQVALAVIAVAVGGTGLFLNGYSAEAPLWSTREFLENLGSLFGTPLRMERLPVSFAVVTGMLLVLTAVITALRDWRSAAHRTSALWIVFLLLSGALIARARIGWGVDYLGQDRYRLYPLLTMVVLYTRYLSGVAKPRLPQLGTAATAAAFGFCVLSYACSSAEMMNGARWTAATAMNQQLGRIFLRTTTARWPIDARDWAQAIRGGHLQPPSLLSPAELESVRSLSRSTATTAHSLRMSATPFEPVNGFLLEPLDRAGAPLPDFAVYLDAGGALVLPIYRARAVLADTVRHFQVFAPNFSLVLPGAVASRGEHVVFGMHRQAGGALQVLWSGVARSP